MKDLMAKDVMLSIIKEDSIEAEWFAHQGKTFGDWWATAWHAPSMWQVVARLYSDRMEAGRVMLDIAYHVKAPKKGIAGQLTHELYALADKAFDAGRNEVVGAIGLAYEYRNKIIQASPTPAQECAAYCITAAFRAVYSPTDKRFWVRSLEAPKRVRDAIPMLLRHRLSVNNFNKKLL